MTPKSEQLTAAFSEALRAAASTQSGSPWKSRVAAGSDPSQLSESLAVALRLRGELEGEMYLCMHEEASRSLLAQAEGTAPADASAAWLGLVEASVEQLGQSLRAAFGETTIEACRLTPPSAQATSLAEVTLQADETRSGAVFVLIDAALRASLGKEPDVAGQGLLAETVQEKAQLHRVIDVPLAVTLRFGQRQLTLRELLELSTGSLVELDRQVEEPVDLMLGERIVARGEVVIVDGNYGMRVTEVVENAVHRFQPSH